MKCDICEIIARTQGFEVYKDEDVVCYLEEKPASVAHLVVAPINHFTIMEQVPDELLGKMAAITTIISRAAFEALGMDGTNILINNGVDAGQTASHFSINILPRKQGDNINLNWPTIEASEQELKEIAEVLKKELEVAQVDKKEEAKQETKEHYIRNIRRIP